MAASVVNVVNQNQMVSGFAEGLAVGATDRAGNPGISNLGGGLGGMSFASQNVVKFVGNGFVVPQLTLTQLAALTSKDLIVGSFVNVINDNSFRVWNGTAFIVMFGGSGGGIQIYNPDLNGGAGGYNTLSIRGDYENLRTVLS